ncbi:multiple sugar transport system permease protein [Propionibacterium cyclohexanicum]|uniref:Multiple sugar transport system permease protein n=1 Tax=Propionibacterium cyclohexanicum TaxID=64702 RepID=A0A1H9SM68_9ACTN|nr:sugar ABC transporter permease [Propionibacterium cyclohexanicum]SER86014.1 multiple sugar transport system permease protein [Propionibacterium cyclohexanicum]
MTPVTPVGTVAHSGHPPSSESSRSGLPGHHLGRARRQEMVEGLALVAPSLLGIAVFLVVPIAVVIWLSVNSWDLIGPMRFVGLRNWFAVLSDPTFGHSLWITLVFVVLVVPVQVALGLAMALLLTRGLPGSGVFRVLYVIPWMCAPLALGVVWQWIFAPSGGALNALTGAQTDWLNSPVLALPIVALVTIWSQVGYTTLFFMAGLAGIPVSVLEAAQIDGASSWQSLWRIRIPLLGPTLYFVALTGAISAFQAFDQIYALTPSGGPGSRTNVMALRIYQEAFQGGFNLGHASVMALVLFVIIVAVTLVQHRFIAGRITYDLS